MEAGASVSASSALPPPRRSWPWVLAALGLAAAVVVALLSSTPSTPVRETPASPDAAGLALKLRALASMVAARDVAEAPDGGDGTVAIRVRASGAPVRSARVWLVPEDRAHQALAPDLFIGNMALRSFHSERKAGPHGPRNG